MQRCSNKAYAMCPHRHLCGPIEEATFTDDSECAAYNREVEDKPMTNADRIRAMSDEELAAWIVDNPYICASCDISEGCQDVPHNSVCKQHIALWLKQPAEGE